jgi:TP901 family phage tail tape measure protein
MSLNAGEVFVVVGARLDSAAIAKAKTSFDEIKASSDRAQAAADASSSAQRRAMTDYAASAKRGEDATKRLEQSLSRAKDAAILTGKVGALGVAGIATALGGAALAAVGFDSAMRNVNSIAGLSQKQFDALEKQVLRLAPSLGASPKELATGLYDIVSTGFKASDAIKILAVSAKAGKAGLTDTATATDAITSALKAYGIGASGAKGVSDLLFETVDVGKLNFQQLASSIGTVLPTASTLGIPLKQLGAAIATITLNGTDAKTATTQLSSIFTAFQKPTKDLTKVFHDQGYETAAAGLKALGLKGSLDLLRKQVSGGHNTWVDFFKDVRALRGAQGLEGTAHAADLFATSTKAMDGATKGAGATQKAFAEQSKSTAVQFDKLKAGIDVAAITIGSALLPKLNEGITALSHWFLQAEKSGDIDRWANDISGAVNEILNEIHTPRQRSTSSPRPCRPHCRSSRSSTRSSRTSSPRSPTSSRQAPGSPRYSGQAPSSPPSAPSRRCRPQDSVPRPASGSSRRSCRPARSRSPARRTVASSPGRSRRSVRRPPAAPARCGSSRPASRRRSGTPT